RLRMLNANVFACRPRERSGTPCRQAKSLTYLIRQLDLNLIPDDPRFENFLAEARFGIIEPGSAADAEPPRVPGARDAAIFHVTTRQRRSHVRAGVVNRRVIAVHQKDGNHPAGDFVTSPLTLGDVADAGDGLKFCHACGTLPE